MLPSKQQRDAAVAEVVAEKNEAERQAEIKRREEAVAHRKKLEETVQSALGSVERYVLYAVKNGKNECHIRLVEGGARTPDAVWVAEQVCKELSLGNTEYDLQLVTEDTGYNDVGHDGDGYPNGNDNWVPRWHQSLKISWK